MFCSSKLLFEEQVVQQVALESFDLCCQDPLVQIQYSDPHLVYESVYTPQGVENVKTGI